MEVLKRLGKVARTARAGTVQEAQRLLFGALRRRRPSGPFNPSPTSLKVYRTVIANKVALIDRLPSKYRKDVADAVWNSVMKGYDESGLAKELHDRFGLTAERAERVAVSQCNMARSVIDSAALIEKGVKEAVWQYEKERCTVKGHEALSGRRYLLAGGALVDGKRVWPGSEPACFCAIREMDAAEDAEG